MSDVDTNSDRGIHLESVTPMAPSEPPRDDEATFSSDDAGLRDAAAAREEAKQFEPVPIEYKKRGDDGRFTNEPAPLEESVSAERAARDLSDYRNQVADQKEQQVDQLTADAIDTVRAQRFGIQPQAQVEPQQPTPQPVEAQPAEQLAPGIDPTLARALTENPQLREALQAEVAQIQAAQQSYIDVTRANAQTAAAALFAAYPELSGAPGDQIKAAIQVISNQNPQRGAEIVNHIQAVNATVAQWQEAQAAQHQQQRRSRRKRYLPGRIPAALNAMD